MNQLVLLMICFGACVYYTHACNEAVCASLVTKCMLLKSCECDMTKRDNCTCCKECHRCLSKLYTECCSCVGLCPERSGGDNEERTSTVEELIDPIPKLFSLLTEEPDPLLRWTTYTYSAHFDLMGFKPDGVELEIDIVNKDDGHRIRHHNVNIDTKSDSMNCTVAYMSHCMSLKKCRDSCESMGAASYRWFHRQACCECIGNTCLNFGKAEPLCLHCPAGPGEDTEEDAAFPYEEEQQGVNRLHN